MPDVAPLPSPEVAVTLWLQGTWRSGVGAGDYIGRLGVDGDAFSLLRDGEELTQSTTQTHKESTVAPGTAWSPLMSKAHERLGF